MLVIVAVRASEIETQYYAIGWFAGGTHHTHAYFDTTTTVRRDIYLLFMCLSHVFLCAFISIVICDICQGHLLHATWARWVCILACGTVNQHAVIMKNTKWFTHQKWRKYFVLKKKNKHRIEQNNIQRHWNSISLETVNKAYDRARLLHTMSENAC